MSCKGIQDRLSAYLDRELNPIEMASIRSHLQDCQGCQMELQSLQALKQMLLRAGVAEPDPSLESRLVHRVLEQTLPKTPKWSLAWRPAFGFAAIGAVSMLVALVVIQSDRGLGTDNLTSDARESSIAFEVQRDQIYTAGTDAFGGMPVIHVKPQTER